MKKILFVDDEERVLQGLRRLTHAKREEWECSFAISVDEAMPIIEAGLDAVVTDLNMPGKDGMVLLRAIRANADTANLPCLVLTGNGEMQAKKTALEEGATDFLSKPVDFWELSARLENCIALKRFQDLVIEQRDTLDSEVKKATKALDNSRKNIILRLAIAAEWRDGNTGSHILRVAMLSAMIARGLGWDEDECERLLLSSPLHDVGKIGLNDAILQKPGRLTDAERATMMKHCLTGFEILAGEHGNIFQFLGGNTATDQGNELLECAAMIALTHHERWDGTGYPRGLQGEEIPLEGRIVAVADVYDALRSKRSYKDEMTKKDTIAVMVEGSGSHFDPEIVDVLLELADDAEEILAKFRDEEDDIEILLAA